ncbi:MULTISPECIES: BMP family ABC transporter substrate-binding protein [unclassified Oceanispirochaeta]|uniref:BMP family ABC transporter substrate-binding protein n=1 Tax=unclassified Oceanispirochaeta TaxID=2635722 RepID=UPI000E09A20D|nr:MULTISPECIES: BMP family ABC transporter substrate-binding protein [unclassified Oceanispirochaeta]MBF9016767.1 BMP family ABC transporter substrate-binding protein [Oceanispirochaeta sp. M2]NPD72037.1 BMP family ABC transporter substrate-binding protein [Oceanispirochaeta sp. M1]RDG32481.1 BMP family ABC transporter substrate-binding protein [Oceanispirochaeta sp. M1]
MKKTLSILMTVLLILSLGLVGCSKKEAPAAAAAEEKAVEAEPLKVVLILNGVLGDKSFFDSADNGMKMIAKKYGDKVSVKTIEMTYDQTKWEPTLQDVSEEDWDIVICGTWQMVEMLQDIAPDYPEKRYVIFDSGVDYSLGNLGNVYSIGYKQNEASFIAGALAARMTSGQALSNDEKMVGFLGGMDIPVINDFLIGYIEGAQYVDAATKVAISYIGSFSDSAKGKEMALAQYNLGVDIGYNVAGQAGLGQLDAAKDVNRYAIGVDSDQAAIFVDSDAAKAELITTSVLKRVDNSLMRAIDLHMEGKVPYGEMEVLGFSEDCVGLAENDIYERVVPADIRSELAEIEKKIVSGDIVVGSAFGMTTEDMNSLRNAVKP